MNFKIIKATIVLGNGTDLVILHTDFPPTMPKVSQQNLTLSFNTQKDMGIEYVRHNFGIEPEVIK